MPITIFEIFQWSPPLSNFQMHFFPTYGCKFNTENCLYHCITEYVKFSKISNQFLNFSHCTKSFVF